MLFPLLGVNYYISRRAVVAFNYLCGSRITHALQWAGELGAVSSKMILKAQIKMLASI
jgi:trans-2-enoyl-CoA reductase